MARAASSYFVVDATRPLERPDAVQADIAAEMQLQNGRITELAGVLQSTINPSAIGVQAKPPLEYSWRRFGLSTYVIVLNQYPPRRSTTQPSKSAGRRCHRRSPS